MQAMKITGLKTFVANASRTNFVVVRLTTDAGIGGVGGRGTRTVIVGQDPFAVEHLIERTRWRTAGCGISTARFLMRSKLTPPRASPYC